MERNLDTLDTHEVVLASALGAMIATVAAAALGFPWWPLAIIGCGVGAFFCFRPKEVFEKLSTACCAAYIYVDSLSQEDVSRFRDSFLRGLLWVQVCCCGIVLSYQTATLVFILAIGEERALEIGGGAIVWCACVLPCMFAFILFSTLFDHLRKEGQGCCGWFLLRALARGMGRITGIDPLKRRDWDDRLLNELEPYAIGKASSSSVLRAMHLAGVVALCSLWYLFAFFFVVWVIDALITLALALASRPRLAVMWGTMIGGTVGYLTFVAHPELPVATFIGMLAGGGAGGGLYRLRLRIVAALQAT